MITIGMRVFQDGSPDRDADLSYELNALSKSGVTSRMNICVDVSRSILP
jgi:hypothetical protein